MEMLSELSFCLFEADHSRHVDDMISHMKKVCDKLEKCSNGSINVVLLKCLDRPLIATFSVWKGHGVNHSLPETSTFTRGMSMEYGVRNVESGWFVPGCAETTKENSSARVCLGDIVSVRRMHTGGGLEKQEMLSYSCLAVNKAYFGKLKGISSYSFYDSVDGKQILGLGVWDGFESASCFLDKNLLSSPALPFWKALGAKKLCYDVFQVVYATNDSPLVDIYDNPPPGFQL